MEKIYWEIGKVITEKQREFGWGKSVVEKLVSEIRNLKQLVSEVPWGQNIHIMQKSKDILERSIKPGNASSGVYRGT